MRRAGRRFWLCSLAFAPEKLLTSDTQGIRNHGRNEIRHRDQLTKARLSFQTETTVAKSSHEKWHVWQLMKRDFGV